MSIQAILMPMFAQVALTFALLFWMTILRLRVIRKGEVRPQQVALREPAWPPHVIQVGNAVAHFNLLFYGLMLNIARYKMFSERPIISSEKSTGLQ